LVVVSPIVFPVVVFDAADVRQRGRIRYEEADWMDAYLEYFSHPTRFII
jgi:hypothetical protein